MKPILGSIEVEVPMPFTLLVVPIVIQCVAELPDEFLRATPVDGMLYWNLVAGIPHAVMPSPISKLLLLHFDKPAVARVGPRELQGSTVSHAGSYYRAMRAGRVASFWICSLSSHGRHEKKWKSAAIFGSRAHAADSAGKGTHLKGTRAEMRAEENRYKCSSI
ncbi:hypothetical protein B0T26DRAFT_679847 [Lasiosphaeria miniovina]|uniref:Uncharacterized protein n=1 Tax=Lasiosphaeria miniovina TaxID=1954250 RepID=A0AA39ZYT4_9PEZI|nr:uncharacterized protein B0T26DRAFT_679847 [Lasiosphaeria miniovina]KAK0706123.1 hypothetical protein B0T26DRAFT_679847 [Lasiosphaeria miniovina]